MAFILPLPKLYSPAPQRHRPKRIQYWLTLRLNLPQRGHQSHVHTQSNLVPSRDPSSSICSLAEGDLSIKYLIEGFSRGRSLKKQRHWFRRGVRKVFSLLLRHTNECSLQGMRNIPLHPNRKSSPSLRLWVEAPSKVRKILCDAIFSDSFRKKKIFFFLFFWNKINK